LRDYMLHGQPLRMDNASGDEVGRLVQVLVLALAHLDRSRAPLLHAGALALERKTSAAPNCRSRSAMPADKVGCVTRSCRAAAVKLP